MVHCERSVSRHLASQERNTSASLSISDVRFLEQILIRTRTDA